VPALSVHVCHLSGLHVLRHSAAAVLTGASAKRVRSVLGHAPAAFTLTVCGHIFNADLDDLAGPLEELAQSGDGMEVGRLSDRSGALGR
jgi:hypothetical protein